MMEVLQSYAYDLKILFLPLSISYQQFWESKNIGIWDSRMNKKYVYMSLQVLSMKSQEILKEIILCYNCNPKIERK